MNFSEAAARMAGVGAISPGPPTPVAQFTPAGPVYVAVPAPPSLADIDNEITGLQADVKNVVIKYGNMMSSTGQSPDPLGEKTNGELDKLVSDFRAMAVSVQTQLVTSSGLLAECKQMRDTLAAIAQSLYGAAGFQYTPPPSGQAVPSPDPATVSAAISNCITDKSHLIQAINTLYDAAGFHDYSTPVGTVAAAIAKLEQTTTQPAIKGTQPANVTNVNQAPAAKPPLLGIGTIIGGVAALAIVGGGIWWWYSTQQKKKLGGAPAMRQLPAREAQQLPPKRYPVAQPARPPLHSSTRPLLPRANPIRALPPARSARTGGRRRTKR